jgi:pantothenate kinase
VDLKIPALYQQRVEELLQLGERCILGLVGAPSAGKSTLAQTLTTQWRNAIQVVPMDGFHPNGLKQM